MSRTVMDYIENWTYLWLWPTRKHVHTTSVWTRKYTWSALLSCDRSGTRQNLMWLTANRVANLAMWTGYRWCWPCEKTWCFSLPPLFFAPSVFYDQNLEKLLFLATVQVSLTLFKVLSILSTSSQCKLKLRHVTLLEEQRKWPAAQCAGAYSSLLTPHSSFLTPALRWTPSGAPRRRVHRFSWEDDVVFVVKFKTHQ